MKFIFTLHQKIKKSQRILFLDRDGVIIKDTGYPHKIESVTFEQKNILKIKKIFENLKFDTCGFITNQSGVSRKIFSENEFWKFHNMLINRCKTFDLIIDFTAVNFFKNNEYYRKPNDGMLRQTISFFETKPENCLFIGDKVTDEMAALKSKVEFKYIQNLFDY